LEVQEAKPREFDDDDVLSMALSNIFAGSDTTAISIGAALYYLCKNPRCMQELRREIDRKRSELELETSRGLTYDAGFSMPYLQACTYEALRMHPAVGMSLPGVVPPNGF
jgi:cytochrome P450